MLSVCVRSYISLLFPCPEGPSNAKLQPQPGEARVSVCKFLLGKFQHASSFFLGNYSRSLCFICLSSSNSFTCSFKSSESTSPSIAVSTANFQQANHTVRTIAADKTQEIYSWNMAAAGVEIDGSRELNTIGVLSPTSKLKKIGNMTINLSLWICPATLNS